MPLSWNEIKSRAQAFSRTCTDASNEDSQAKPFWIDSFEIFGITDKRVATFVHSVKGLPGVKARTDAFADLFWPGLLLVEHRSQDKNLELHHKATGPLPAAPAKGKRNTRGKAA